MPRTSSRSLTDSSSTLDETTAFARAVLAHEIVACHLVKKACERHLRDLELGAERGLVWSAEAAQFRIGFYPRFLKHSKGEFARKPLVLSPWQKFIIGSVFGWKRADGTRRFRSVYQEVPRKSGKSTMLAGVGLDMLLCDDEPGAEVYCAAPLALHTAIPTADGWKTMGTVAVGDRVFDERGKQCAVTYVSPILDGRPCFRITFSDGTTVVSDAEHRWLTDAISIRGTRTGSRRLPTLRCEGGRKAVFTLHNRRHHVCRWSDPLRQEKFAHALEVALARAPLVRGRLGIRTTSEIAANVFDAAGVPNHRVPAALALECNEARLPIPPYTLGAWLGDGSSRGGKLVGDRMDDVIAKEIEADGFTISDHGKGKLREFTALGLRTLLRQAGLLRNKHVPAIYFRASIGQRLSLLQGLMDTDGTCTKTGECRFTNRNRGLALAVRDLVRGIGLRARLREVEVEGAPHYVVSFKAFASAPVFRLPRKAARLLNHRSETLKWRQILSVEPVASEPVRCISVDSPSRLYLVTDGLIATHNTKKEQARIIFDEAKRMVSTSQELSNAIARFKLNLSVDATASKFEPLSSDEKTLDGLNPHCVLIDELHAHKTRALLDVLDTAVGARRQPLIWIITTAGDDNPASVYASEHAYAVDLLEGVLTNDSVFAFIATVDKDDRWDDPAAWARANPNLGVSVKLDDLERQAEKAKGSPAALNAFKRLRLNIRTSDVNRVIPAEEWAKNTSGSWSVDDLGVFDAEGQRVRRARCWGGLDLSSKIDITAWVKLFEPDEAGVMKVAARFWMPEATIDARGDRDAAHYRQWANEGWIFTTPGNVIDHEEIYETIVADSEQFDIVNMAFDPWSQSQLGIKLNEKGIEAHEFIQGLRSYTEPTKELQALVFARKIDHGGNPVLAWMANNLAVQRDKNLNEMPHKAHSKGRIDGMTALIMAIGRQMQGDDQTAFSKDYQLRVLE